MHSCSFRLLFGGTIPHYFYSWLERAVSEEASFAIVKKLLIERLIYSPLFTAFSLYTISRLEGKDHKTALRDVEGLYWTILTSSWKYLTILQLINLSIVPPAVGVAKLFYFAEILMFSFQLRVLIVNLIGFFWTIYIANKRRQQSLKRGQK